MNPPNSHTTAPVCRVIGQQTIHLWATVHPQWKQPLQAKAAQVLWIVCRPTHAPMLSSYRWQCAKEDSTFTSKLNKLIQKYHLTTCIFLCCRAFAFLRAFKYFQAKQALNSPLVVFLLLAQLGERCLFPGPGAQGTGAWQWFMKLCHLRLMWDDRERRRRGCKPSRSPCRTAWDRAACREWIKIKIDHRLRSNK